MNKKEEYYELLKHKKTSMDRPYYDYTIDFDVSKLPQILKNEITALENADLRSDWITYDAHLDEIEPILKNMVINKIITESEYAILMKKYGGE